MRSTMMMSVALAALVAMPAVSSAQLAGSVAGQRLANMPLDPYPSTYVPRPSPVTAIIGATIHTGTGATIDRGTVVMQGGKVIAIGADVDVPDGAVVVDGTGKFVTPGIIDAHSHVGVGGEPTLASTSDVNEATDPNTAEVWAEHAVWPQDAAFVRAIAGGVTTQQVLVGSANLFGGRSVVIKNVWSRTVQGMKFPDAKQGLKMACGENPKRVYGDNKRSPSTRMANFAGYRAGWIKALEYQYEWDQFRAKQKQGDPAAKPPKIDLELETLAGALRGDILVQMHCYRADEMALVIDMAKEFGYRVTQFHHAVEAYKVRDLLARENICASVWADWWGFKMESFDGIEENAALVHDAGACAVVHSDSNVGIQRLNQEAAKAMAAGRRMGLTIGDGDAIRWVTLNPAKSLGLDDRIGSLEPGKNADVVLWDGNPLSVYGRAEKVYIDGALTFDLNDPGTQYRSDFELGQSDKEIVR